MEPVSCSLGLLLLSRTGRCLNLQGDFLLVVGGDLLLERLPVVGAVVGIVPGVLVRHVELLVAVGKVVLGLLHITLEVLVLLSHPLELQEGPLFLSIELGLLLSQLIIFSPLLFVGLLCLDSLLHLVLQVVLSLNQLRLGEVHHLAFKPLEEPGGSELGLDVRCLGL